MGYAYYKLPGGREAGYGVDAECDQPGCQAEINRGLGYLCGDSPGDPEYGCGRYFCGLHLMISGDPLWDGYICQECVDELVVA